MQILNVDTRLVTAWTFRFTKKTDMVSYLPKLFSLLEEARLLFIERIGVNHIIFDRDENKKYLNLPFDSLLHRGGVLFEEYFVKQTSSLQDILDIIQNKEILNQHEILDLSISGHADVFFMDTFEKISNIMDVSINFSTDSMYHGYPDNKIEIGIFSDIFFPLDFDKKDWNLDIYNANKNRLTLVLKNIYNDVKAYLLEEDPMHPPRYEWIKMEVDKLGFEVYAYDFGLYIDKEDLSIMVEKYLSKTDFNLDEYYPFPVMSGFST